jgi:RimJ/RimL family protein N-acetyltransferase
MTPKSWSISLATIVDGAVVGTTALVTHEFPTMRQFETGSWLGRPHQGKGLGKEMRVATLQLGFIGFGGEHATTSAWHDNKPSLGVTRSLGYSATGHRRQLRRTDGDIMQQFEMSRADFVARLQRDDITLHGVAECLPLLGLEAW